MLLLILFVICSKSVENSCSKGNGEFECKTCTENKCVECNANGYGVKDDNTCEKCSEDQVVDENTHKCKAAPPACTQGNGEFECKTCTENKCVECNANGYGVKDDNTCEKCSEDQIVDKISHKCIDDSSNSELSSSNDQDISSISEIITEEPSQTLLPGQCDSSVNVIGCISCSNDHKQCLKCNEKLGFKANAEDGKCQCVNSSYEIVGDQCVPETTFCSESMISLGCSLCLFGSVSTCLKCNEKNGFKSQPNASGQCECDTIGYSNIENQGFCSPILANCNENIIGCSRCLSISKDKCFICDTEKGFKFDDKNENCICASQGFEIENGRCIPPQKSGCNETLSIIGCIQCSSNPNQCSLCDESKFFNPNPDSISGNCTCQTSHYEPNSNGVCAPPILSGCNQSAFLPGCIKCENDSNLCSFCDSNFNFEIRAESNGKCKCAEGFSLRIDGQCTSDSEDPGVIVPPLVTEIDLPDTCISKNENSLNLSVFGINDNPSRVYTSEVIDTINTLRIVKNQNDNVVISVVTRENPLIIDIVNDQKVNIQPKGSLPLVVPANSIGLSLSSTNDAKVTLNTDKNDKDKDIKLGNMNISNSEMDLNSNGNVLLNIVNLFDANSKLIINKDNPNSDGTVSANKINVQQAAGSTLQNIVIKESLNLAPFSRVALQTVSYSNAIFNIYKNISQKSDDKEISYFDFNENVIESPRSIVIRNIMKDQLLLDKQDAVIIISEEKRKFNETMCKEWASKVTNSDGEYGNAQCITSDSSNNAVWAYKRQPSKPNNDKKKLSGGAIAGIVIACVVVVAVIIALLVYFLVIKKKKESTTSTQGDSSIAI